MSEPSASPAGDRAPLASGVYAQASTRWYACIILTLVYGCHAIDRNMPNILLEPIRHEFHLTDFQLGAFSGFAYAIAFSLTVVPLGWIVDRLSRRKFLTTVIIGWSVFTALSGLARSYALLVAARIGIGVTEAGAAPAAMSMISDIFPARQRGRALGLFYISQAIGVMVAGTVGGFVAANYGWRTAFFIAGVPGLILAATLFLTVREPRRGGSDGAEYTGPAPGFIDVFRFFLRTPGLIALIFGCACLGMVNLAIASWLGSFFIRIHHLDLKQTGLVLGLASGLGAMVGAPLQGWLADRLQARDRRWPLRVVVIASALSMVSGFVMLFTDNLALAIGCVLLGDLCRMGYSPPAYSLFLTRTPVHLRGSAMSVMQLMSNIFGFGIGPAAIGLLSDLHGGADSLRYAMAYAIGFTAVVIVLFLISMHLLFGPRGGASDPILAEAEA